MQPEVSWFRLQVEHLDQVGGDAGFGEGRGHRGGYEGSGLLLGVAPGDAQTGRGCQRHSILVPRGRCHDPATGVVSPSRKRHFGVNEEGAARLCSVHRLPNNRLVG